MAGGPGKHWKFVRHYGAARWENQTTEKYFTWIMGPGVKLSKTWKKSFDWNFICEKVYEPWQQLQGLLGPLINQ